MKMFQLIIKQYTRIYIYIYIFRVLLSGWQILAAICLVGLLLLLFYKNSFFFFFSLLFILCFCMLYAWWNFHKKEQVFWIIFWDIWVILCKFLWANIWVLITQNSFMNSKLKPKGERLTFYGWYHPKEIQSS